MAVATTKSRDTFIGNGVTRLFALDFVFQDASSLSVTLVNNTTLSVTSYVLGVDYTVIGGAGLTGSVSSVSAHSASFTLVVDRVEPTLQAQVYSKYGAFPAKTVEAGFDRLVYQTQRLTASISRTLRQPAADLTDIGIMPNSVSRAGMYLTFNATTGDPECINSVVSVSAIAGISAAIATVAGISASVSVVAGISANVTTVAGISANVTKVAGISANVTTVAGISASVVSVASISANITTVAGISASVVSVASISASVSLIASISASVSLVAGISANVTTVAGISASVSTVAAISATVIEATLGNFRWNYSTSITMGDPGAGLVRLNAASFSATTRIAFSVSSADGGSPNVGAFLDTVDDSTNTVKGHIIIRDLNTAGVFAVYSISNTISDGTTWKGVSVTYVAASSSSGAPTLSDILAVQFIRSGDAGAGSGNVNSVSGVSSGDVATYSGTAGTSLTNIGISTLLRTGTTSQVISGGATFSTSVNGNLGTVSSASFTANPGLCPLQYYTNNGAHGISAPAADGGVDYLITNGASAGAITFLSFTVGSNVGSTPTTTNGNKFLLSIRRINAVSTYSFYALQ